ncbi:MAG: carboxymuconolactone decarboxylase family protein [Acidimicrobiia bacterium]
MARVRLITDRDGLSPEQAATFDWVVESRGRMIRPFEVLLHAPGIARHVAELGAKIRFDSSLSDHDRELVIITAARVHDCGFEWVTHLPLARSAGVRPEVIEHLTDGTDVDLLDTEDLLIGFVRELSAASRVSERNFNRAKLLLGETGVVELSATIGYYTLLAMVMGAADACQT